MTSIEASTMLKTKIESRDMMNFLKTERDYWQRFGRQTLERIRDEGLRIYREEAPEGETRKLRKSLFSEIRDNKVILGYDLGIAPYAEIIDGHGKTARTEGRYVPMIGRRLVRPSKRNPSIGWHPGATKTPFTERTMIRLEQLVDKIIRQIPRL